jgi:hypothetical protein
LIIYNEIDSRRLVSAFQVWDVDCEEEKTYIEDHWKSSSP